MINSASMYYRVPEVNKWYNLDPQKVESPEEQEQEQEQESDIESSEMDTSMDSGTSGGGMVVACHPCQPQMIWIIRWVPLVKSVVSDMPCLQNCFIYHQNDLKCLKFLDIPSKSLPSVLKYVPVFCPMLVKSPSSEQTGKGW